MYRLSMLCSILLLFFGVRAGAQSGTDEGVLVESNNRFAFEVYQRLSAEPGNLVFAPYSISQLMAMVYAGAQANTADEIASVLHFDLPEAALHEQFGALLRALQAANQPEAGVTLRLVNGLWPQQGFDFAAEFMQLMLESYASEVQALDYASDPEGARQRINEAIGEQTEGKIPELLPPSSILPLTRMVLTNALYFKGNWALAFNPDATRPQAFRLADGSEREVPMMRAKRRMAGTNDGEIVAALLPYAGERLAMLLLTSAVDEPLDVLEERLNAELLREVLAGLTIEESHLVLPTWEGRTPTDLKVLLHAMGVQDAFDIERADFSGMTGARDLYISSAFHEAYILVNESGTEAAAASAAVMTLRSAPPPSAPPRELVFDRPFVYLILDQQTGAILFVGRLSEPQ